MENDLRLRYYYIIELDNKEVFRGYLLHEEAWIFLKQNSIKRQCSIMYDQTNTSLKSDTFDNYK